MATVKVKAEGKSGFLKEFFVDHPDAGKSAINEAWREAGNEGTISDSLTSKIRRDLGLTGKGRGTAEAKASVGAGKRSSAAPKSKGGRTTPKAAGRTAKANGRLVTETLDRPAERQSSGEDRTTLLIRLEGEIDDMLHEIRVAGGLPEFEEALRRARRVLARSHGE
jgi:hypothetical protein